MSEETAPPIEPPTGDPEAAIGMLEAAAAALLDASPSRVQVEKLGELLTRLQAGLDVAAGVATEWGLAFEEAGGPGEAGHPTFAAWSRQELRETASASRRRTKAAAALRALPSVREASATGAIKTAHVDAIAQGLDRLGPDAMRAAEQIVLDVARVCDADAVRATIRKLRATLDPDAADAAYLHALEKRDVKITPVGDGYAVGGFLDPETGAAFSAVLYSFAKPDGKDDDRPPGHRRVDGLRDLCTSVLAHGLPTDRGLRPQLFVTIPADRLPTVAGSPIDALGRDASAAAEPAMLSGFGPISDLLAGKLACDAVRTPIAVDDKGNAGRTVLDVGRSTRLATLKQRQAVFVAQDGECAAPGCTRTHLELHHRTPWSEGGATDLANLAGYCTRCHHLIHLGRLIVTRDPQTGRWRHRRRSGHYLPDRRRIATHRTRQWISALLAGGLAHANRTLRS